MGSVGIGIVLTVLTLPLKFNHNARLTCGPLALETGFLRLRRGSLCEKPYLRSLNRGNTRKGLEIVAGRSVYDSLPTLSLIFCRWKERVNFGPSPSNHRCNPTCRSEFRPF
jgi:hypothetical protein